MGHLDIISRASKLFGSVVVLVSVNAAKHSAFTLEERVELARKATAHLPNVRVDSFDGLLVDYLRGLGDCAIVKACGRCPTLNMNFRWRSPTKSCMRAPRQFSSRRGAEHMYLSSSLVKQIAHFGGDISGFVPDSILQEIQNRCRLSCKREEGLAPGERRREQFT